MPCGNLEPEDMKIEGTSGHEELYLRVSESASVMDDMSLEVFDT